MNSALINVVMRAAHEIERDGRLRSQLRRADSASDVFGLAEASNFDIALRAVHPWIARNDALPDECLILIAQRNVATPKPQGADMHNATPLAVLLGGREEGDRALSGLRFQRLMSASAGKDRLRQVRRALSLLKQPAHPVAVVEAYLDLQGESGARRFANLYFTGALPSAGQPTAATISAQGITP